jgi:hypothetical protein
MCDLVRACVVRGTLLAVFGATVGLAARPLAAQSLLDARRHQRDEAIDVLMAQRRADSLSVLRNPARIAETIRAAGASMMAVHELADTARRALIVMDSLLQRYSIRGAVPDGASYQLRRNWTDRTETDSAKVTWYLDRIDAQGHAAMLDWWRGAPPSFALGLRIASDRGDQAFKRLPPAFQAWLGHALIDSALTGIWPSAYAAIATSPTLVGKRCLLGDLAGCRQALRLEPVKDPLTEWLTASARRQMALTLRGTVESWAHEKYQDTPRDSVYAEAKRCFDMSDDASCTAFLRAFSPTVADEPLGSEGSRQALLITALQMRGAPGFAAALARPALGASASLEAMSGATVDVVIDRWRQRVMAAQPERVVLTAPRTLAALTWILALGALSLKGTRWR